MISSRTANLVDHAYHDGFDSYDINAVVYDVIDGPLVTIHARLWELLRW